MRTTRFLVVAALFGAAVGGISCGPRPVPVQAARPVPLPTVDDTQQDKLDAEEDAAPDPTPTGHEFPTAQELESVATLPVPAPAAKEVEDVAVWTLGGPMRDRVDLAHRVAHGGPWNAIVDAAVADGKGSASESAACLSRELARFLAKHGKEPAQDLAEFIAARCGTDMIDAQIAVQSGEASPSTTETSLSETAKPALAKRLAAWAEASREVGIGFARGRKKIYLVLVAIRRTADIEPFALVPAEDGTVRIRGKVRSDSGNVTAMVGHGLLGVEKCESENLAPPDFSFVCHTDKADRSEWITIDSTPPGRFLSHEVFSALVFPAGKPVDVYSRPSLPASATPGASAVEDLLAAVNSVRDGAKLGRLHEAKDESDVASRVAPHFFGAKGVAGDGEAGTDAERGAEDRIALGLLAGWSVGEPIRYGKFISTHVPKGSDRRRMLASLLERPDGRSVLLDPEATLVAVGESSTPGHELVGSVVATYAPIGIESEASREAKVAALITRERAKKKLAPMRRLQSLYGAASAAVSSIENDHVTSKRALRVLMRTTANQQRTGTSGFRLEAERLDDLKLPPEMVDRDSLALVIAVAWVCEPDAAWGHYVILLVSPQLSPT